MSEDVTEAEVAMAAIDSRWLDLHKAGPARVESYNASANTVTVTPVLWRQIPTDDGDYVAEALPQIPDVKIAWPRAGGFAITFPIQPGDFVMLVFGDAPLGAWRQNGQPGDPGDPERHGLSGAMAIPGVYPDKQNITSPSTTNMVLGKIGTAAAQIEITPTGVNLGAGANDNVVTKADIAAIKLAISGAAVAPNDGGATLKANIIAAWPASVGSSTTKSVR